MPLTELEIRNAKPKDKPYKLTDGGWLFLLVTPNGSKLWRLSPEAPAPLKGKSRDYITSNLVRHSPKALPTR